MIYVVFGALDSLGVLDLSCNNEENLPEKKKILMEKNENLWEKEENLRKNKKKLGYKKIRGRETRQSYYFEAKAA